MEAEEISPTTGLRDEGGTTEIVVEFEKRSLHLKEFTENNYCYVYYYGV